MLHTYFVMTPEYETVLPILDDGTGPSEWRRDVTKVQARTKAEAIRLGYAQLKCQVWFTRHYEYDKHPYAYLTVERLLKDDSYLFFTVSAMLLFILAALLIGYWIGKNSP